MPLVCVWGGKQKGVHTLVLSGLLYEVWRGVSLEGWLFVITRHTYILSQIKPPLCGRVQLAVPVGLQAALHRGAGDLRAHLGPLRIRGPRPQDRQGAVDAYQVTCDSVPHTKVRHH
jgi:hypothetical protein